jgi:hypothetical protein
MTTILRRGAPLLLAWYFGVLTGTDAPQGSRAVCVSARLRVRPASRGGPALAAAKTGQ